MSPGEPKSDEPNKNPAYSMATGIPKSHPGIVVDSQGRRSTKLLIADTSWARRRSHPPHAQSHHDFCRARLPPYLWASQGVHAKLCIGGYHLGKILFSPIFGTHSKQHQQEEIGQYTATISQQHTHTTQDKGA